MRNVWTGATPSTLKKRDRIYRLLSFNDPEWKGLLELLTERIAQLPEVPKKILAMYYCEDLHLADIAPGFNLSKTQVCQIHAEAVNALRKYMCSVRVERDRNEGRPEYLL